MKFQSIQTNALRPSLVCMALMAGLCLATSSKATVPVSDLPNFNNLSNFGLFGNQLDLNQATVFDGNVGVSENGLLNLASPSTVNGDVFVANGATFNNSGHLTGNAFTGQDLVTEQNAVFTVSENLDALPADQIISGNQTAALSFDVPAGQVEVVDLNGGLNLNNVNISETGDGVLVLNVLGSFSLSGTANILGPNAFNVFVNYLGTSAMSTQPGDVTDGEVFIPNAAANLEGTWEGAIYSGNQMVTLLDDATLNAMPVPEPGTVILAALGGISMILLRRRNLV